MTRSLFSDHLLLNRHIKSKVDGAVVLIVVLFRVKNGMSHSRMKVG